MKTGLVWSAAFALAAVLGGAVLYAIGIDAATLLRTPLPNGMPARFVFFALGGFIAPVAEEIFFRGIVYGFFRRWGVPVAIGASTVIFVLMHSLAGIPVTQAVGGIVFAVAYETSKRLMAPMIIHILGNCAIFGLSLLARGFSL